MPGGGGQGDADSAALQAVRGVTVAQVCLPQAVQAHQQVAGGGRQGDAHRAALQTKKGIDD